MSKRGQVAEGVAWGETLLGLFLKWNLAIGGNILLLLGLSSLSLIYFMRAFLPAAQPALAAESDFSPSYTSPELAAPASKADFLEETVLPKITGIASAIVFIGTSFKLLNLPGNWNLLVAGTGALLIVVLLLALRQPASRPAMVIGALGILMLLLPDELLIRQFHRDDPVLVDKMIYQLHHPQDPAASAAVRHYLQQKRTTE